MEMTIAFYRKNPIFILNPISHTLPIKEEVYGVNPIFLDGNLHSIKQKRLICDIIFLLFPTTCGYNESFIRLIH